jgi:hypothetical protein
MAVFAVSCTKTTTIRHAEDYKNSVIRGKHVLILPPEVEVNTLDVSGKKTRMDEYENHLRELIRERLVVALEKNHLRARVLRAKDINDLELYRPLNHLRASYDELSKELYKTPAMYVKTAFVVDKNIKEKAAIFGEKTSSDILVFVDYDQVVRTNGARALKFLAAAVVGVSDGSLDDVACMMVAFIDANTGRFVWSNLTYGFGGASGSGGQKADLKHMDKMIADVLKEFMREEKKKK